jgi:L-ascorbate metabolism protein UlaG (beta-lactamase superfamily)
MTPMSESGTPDLAIQWHGQSAYTLRGGGSSVLIDPFDMSQRPAGMISIRFEYPQTPPQDVDLLLITHEHFDHNGASIAAGDPHTVRSTAGRMETPAGEVVAIASEHDPEAGTLRGPNTVFVFALGGVRVCHMGDFGQSSLRPEQQRAIGAIDVLFIPVGGGPTIDAAQAATITRMLQPRWVVPMHYGNEYVDFVAPPDAFLAEFESVTSFDTSAADLAAAPADGALHVVHLAPPASP